ncbi:MAG: medium chain dehydrogenase/reductase family protein [Thermoanaerobaculia bacterium]
MRKVVVHRPGGHERLEIEEHPRPEPRPGEVRIEVAAAGVNFADSLIRMGLYQSSREQVGWPVTPGFEVAGRVAELGAGVADVAVGDEVLAVTLFGGYATEVVVPRDQVFAVPERVTLEEAAAFPSPFLTAYYGLIELARPRSGEAVLVHSAAGGVGGALVQLARVRGCRVVGVVGAAHKVETARKLGADEVIDRSSQGLWAEAERLEPEGYAVVCDANGVATLKQSYRHLRRPGKLVVYGFHSMLAKGTSRPSWPRLALAWLRTPRFDPLRMTNSSRSVLAFNLSYFFDQKELLREMMEHLLEWLEEGRIEPPPVTPYPLERVAEAHRAIESGQSVGKLVLTIQTRTPR